jgi:CTP:molybdopterin cytidylyltransferase MocA
MVNAVILAGGDSSRMGTPKALLRAPDGRAFLTRIAEELLAGGVDHVVIVTGRHHDASAALVARTLDPDRVTVVRNPQPERGQVSSLWAGMDVAVAAATQALVVTLVDVPLIDASLVRRLIETWSRTGAPIVRPAVGERHGHPVVFDRRLFEALRVAPLHAGAKSVVQAHASSIVNLPVDDPGCLRDVDTPGDYASLGAEPGC